MNRAMGTITGEAAAPKHVLAWGGRHSLSLRPAHLVARVLSFYEELRRKSKEFELNK